MLKIFNKISKILSKKRKITFLFFIFLTFISSFVDAVSIGLIIPFIGLFLNYNTTIAFLSKFNFLDLSLEEPAIYFLITTIFVSGIIFSTIFKIFQSYYGAKLSDMLRYEISSNFYFKLVNLKTLNHDYINESNSNSNIQKMNYVAGFIAAFLSFITHLLNLILIGVLLIVIDIKLFFYLLTMGFALIFFNQFFKSLLIKNGKLISNNMDERTKILNNTIGYLPFIMLNNLNKFFYKIFTKSEYQISKSNLLIIFFSKTPNLIYMALITILFSLVVLNYKIGLSNEMFIERITIFSGIIIALMRSLPQIVNLQGSLSTLRACRKPTEDVIEYINKIKNSHYIKKKKIIHQDIKTIKFKNLNYSYKEGNKKINVIKKIDLKIEKGDKIFIYGESGSGKTTIIKLILGLLKPDYGNIYVNSKKINYDNFSNINKKISYVPQDIFLFNDSFLNNLTIGIDQIDHKKIIKHCKIAKIHNFITRKKKGYNSEVSHYARNISGGQKQRIGIARALISQPEILVLDESTNSMDPKTELQVLKNIKKEFKDKTIICVSHNQNLYKLFDKYYVLKNNKLINVKNT
jgi:ATP-binding cassette, subfamily B, bacterial PglK